MIYRQDDIDNLIKEVGIIIGLKPVFDHQRPVHKLTIHYKGGEEWHVKNARDIIVKRSKSGGFDVQYDYTKKTTQWTGFGVETVNSDVHVVTDTHDVVALTLETRRDQQVYTKEYVEFGK